jgi:hypothetical protein
MKDKQVLFYHHGSGVRHFEPAFSFRFPLKDPSRFLHHFFDQFPIALFKDFIM